MDICEEGTMLKSVWPHVRTNVVYGLVVIIPLAVVVLLLAKLVEVLNTIGQPVARWLDVGPVAAAVAAVVLGILFLVVTCFVIGTFIRTRVGAWSFDTVERAVLKRVPGYDLVHNVLHGFVEKKSAYPAALISLFGPGTSVFGFVMEDNGDDTLTVFVPSAPTLTVGAVHVVERQRVRLLESGAIALTDCIGQWGAGSAKLLGKTAS
jgi:uncharacterized membrane protein